MAKGPRYRVPYRRRRENKTDYKARRILAISEKSRFVVRSSNKNIVIQLISSKAEGDIVKTQASSLDLRRYGWLGGKKNTSAAYLIGLIAGKKALNAGIKKANLDIGLARPSRGSKIFASVKGAHDAGLEISCNSDVLPDTSRINGELISQYATILEEPDKYQRLFSGYLKRGLKPEVLPDHFNHVKTKIEETK